MRVLSIIVSELLMAFAGVVAYDQWPRELNAPRALFAQAVTAQQGRAVVSWPGRHLVGSLASFDDPLFAYLIFDYYRSQTCLAGTPVLLITDRSTQKLEYRILLRLPDDLISGLDKLSEFRAMGLAKSVDDVASIPGDPPLEFEWISPSELRQAFHETDLFNRAFADPGAQTLEQLPAPELRSYVRQFIRFKSIVDPRTWNAGRFVLSPVSEAKADRLAEDIIDVADFYNIPVELFLGIGAMENNFLDAPGDLDNAVWKRRPEPDDIVLQKKGRRSWILNSSTGVWQITRQSLRHAQQLFLKDDRDYSRLPTRLQPTKELDLDNFDASLLTTYAGLLLRELMDKFDGNSLYAVGAYNGTIDRPNLQYAAGVETVASYARRVISCTADLNRLAAAQAAVVERAELGRAAKLVVGIEGLSPHAGPP